MPVYEFYCRSCDGIFEELRQIHRAGEQAPCPVCGKSARRVPPTSFSARTIRDGYPRAIPDRGTYWHLGKEVKRPITGPARPNEHPEINKPRPKAKKAKGELEIARDKRQLQAKERQLRRKWGVREVIDTTRRRDDD